MSQYTVEIQMEYDCDERVVSMLRRAAVATLQHEEVTPPAALTLLLTGDEPLRQLNREFLGYDKVTDVLSFPAGEPMPGMKTIPEMAAYLGDIAISVPQAARQAAGQPLEGELQLLVVHGVLHLLGYDHAGPGDEAAMWGVQNAILASLM